MPDVINAVERNGKLSWNVTAGRRKYTAVYHDDPEVFPLDRWEIRNSRGTRCAWDSAASKRVETLVRQFERSMTPKG
ncbi:hypothetical protein SEA_STROSAHL_99 [Gordonia phage Strosahl]|uniref:Uncharacterized protein n=3 Tax=Soupsvirus TaxID=1982562 RepID=A0A1B3B1J0_9CAUD|nr:hypothetical protein BIZ67_gp011 [Gordonia phage Remus]YP_009596300.1 hypothetical protein FDH03_gp011 [Gordonia phage Strosahl]YP_009624612.1 hypothetical protein FDJ48_gp013 [Gordonia phage Waits]AOE44702.1 hypothetical protein SEA_REMUS_99 [Gordonia phage Remus]AOE44809.1 hypothetical protein SEA_STROSAHL_99 [Gordonia phage Strosahl]AVO22124.1 hypothetical protein PBI_WAITS_97 [Gordonia phage Waits]